MPLFPYNRDIPDAPNNPADDQPDMKENFNSIDDLIEVDHFSFDDSLGGLHKQITLENTSLIANEQVLITADDDADGESQIFIESDNSGNTYQLTRMKDADFSSFGGFVAGTVEAGYSMTTGWTFLPGNLLFQYGQVTRAGGISPSDISVTFPVTFSSTDVIVTVTPISKSSGSLNNNTASVRDTSVTDSGFTCKFQTSTADYKGFTWTAIGI